MQTNTEMHFDCTCGVEATIVGIQLKCIHAIPMTFLFGVSYHKRYLQTHIKAKEFTQVDQLKYC